MTREEFEIIVQEGILAIPKGFLKKLDNVGIVIEDEPTRAQLSKMKVHPRWTLFGLYEGIPRTGRTTSYSGVLPDKITIFQKSIERNARSVDEIKEIVKNTVWHEIAHHFGMDEERIRKAEIHRKKKKQSFML